MENLIHTHKTFEKVSFTDKKVNNREFEDCIFKNCDFSNSNFCSNTFMDCEFIDCNLSMTQLGGTATPTTLDRVMVGTATPSSGWIIKFK